MLELAHQGAQVMQVRAVELGWVNDVVIEVLSSFEEAPGTLIKEDPLVEQRNKVRGLAHDRNVAKVTLVAVPDRCRAYAQKLTEIFQQNNIASVTVVHMEVPCCTGLKWAVNKALEGSGKQIPTKELEVKIGGEIVEL